MKTLTILLLVLASAAYADRASDRDAIQSILGATDAQMDSLEIWYPGTDVVVDFTDRAKHYFGQYRDQWEAINGKDRTSQIAVANARRETAALEAAKDSAVAAERIARADAVAALEAEKAAALTSAQDTQRAEMLAAQAKSDSLTAVIIAEEDVVRTLRDAIQALRDSVEAATPARVVEDPVEIEP